MRKKIITLFSFLLSNLLNLFGIFYHKILFNVECDYFAKRTVCE